MTAVFFMMILSCLGFRASLGILPYGFWRL
ncbi:MAG: hypothetical protein RLZ93_492 [Bacteroidota bacterium]